MIARFVGLASKAHPHACLSKQCICVQQIHRAPRDVADTDASFPLSFVTLRPSQDPQLAPLKSACAGHPELVLTPVDITTTLEGPDGHKDFASGVLLVGGGLEALGSVASLMDGGVDSGGFEGGHTSAWAGP